MRVITNEMSDNSMCKKCEGACCKKMGCHLHPEDLKSGDTYDVIKSMLDSGRYSIDWWDCLEINNDNYTEAYYLRARHKNERVVDPSWGGECVMLTEKGCSLSFDERPFGGKSLIAGKDDCEVVYSKYQCAIDWLVHREVLLKLKEEYKN